MRAGQRVRPRTLNFTQPAVLQVNATCSYHSLTFALTPTHQKAVVNHKLKKNQPFFFIEKKQFNYVTVVLGP